MIEKEKLLEDLFGNLYNMEKRINDINLLKPNFKLKVELFLNESKQKGFDIVVFESLRTLKRQEELYAQWRTTDWNVVTWTLKSKHLLWEAVDIVFKDEKWNITWDWDYQGLIKIANKYWIDNLYPTETAHFQCNWLPYKPMIPKEFNGLEVKQVKFDRVWLMKLKWVNTKEEDHIIINPSVAEKWEAWVNKVLLHEFAHFIYHRYLKEEVFEKIDTSDMQLTKYEYWDYISKNLKHYISDYASTHTAEDFAELIWYGYYIENNIELPKKATWNDDVKFKYIIANNLYKQGLNKYIKQ